MKLRLTLQESSSRSLSHFSQPPWVTNRNAQLQRPFPEAPTSHVQAPAHKNTVSEGTTQIHWHPDFTKEKREVRQMEWLATQLVSDRSRMRTNSPVPSPKLCLIHHTPVPETKGWLPDYSHPNHPSINNQKHIIQSQPEARPGSYSSDTDGLTVLSTVLCLPRHVDNKYFRSVTITKKQEILFWGILFFVLFL